MTYDHRGPIPDTLADALCSADIDMPVAIGAASSFLFIGELSRYAENVQAIEHYCRKRAREVYNSNVREAKKGNKPFPSPLPPFVLFSERKVRDIYYRRTDDEPLTLVVLIEGDEIGFQWFAHELEEAEEKYLSIKGRNKNV